MFQPLPVKLALLTLLLFTAVESPSAAQHDPLRIEVTLDQAIYSEPVTGRLLVFFSPTENPEPRFGGPLSALEPVVALDVVNFTADDTAVIDVATWSRPEALSFPGPLRRLEPGRYFMQALLDTNRTARDFNQAAGNLYGPIVEREIHPTQSGLVRLSIDSVIEPTHPEDTEWVELAEFRSEMLSDFYGWDHHHRAGVILPPGYHENTDEYYPVVYVIPGFGGKHTRAWSWIDGPYGEWWKAGDWPMPMIRIVLDPDVPLGHHKFANSANKGPVGDAFIQEFIPYLEENYRIIPETRARFVKGHSSGGWSSLWLQVTYPDVFGGTWSTGPDPVDYRAFQIINAYKDENAYWDELGHPRPSMRQDGEIVLTIREENLYEYVTGPGGQWGSWFAAFGPRGDDGLPVRPWHPLMGQIDHDVFATWRPYEIRTVLEENWDDLGPRLQNKLHVIGGAEDNYYLEISLRMLQEFLDDKDHGGYIEIHPGDHGSFLTPEVIRRMYEEMAGRYRTADR
jgi:hypothetical protein